MEQHGITPEALHTLLASNHEVLVFDDRQPLDLLADPEIIVGARRIPPKDLLENPTLIPKEKDSVFTVPGKQSDAYRHDSALIAEWWSLREPDVSGSSQSADPKSLANGPLSTAEKGSIGAWCDEKPRIRHDGVRIDRIAPDGPADQAGLRIGDDILALDGIYPVHRRRIDEHNASLQARYKGLDKVSQTFNHLRQLRHSGRCRDTEDRNQGCGEGLNGGLVEKPTKFLHPLPYTGAGCSCHPTGAQHHLSIRVPLHPVWQTPVARFPGLIRGVSFRLLPCGRRSTK